MDEQVDPRRPGHRLPITRPPPSAKPSADADPSAFGDLDAELQRHVTDAAAIVGAAPDGMSVAAAIESRRDWDDGALAALQRAALDAGAVLRRLAAAVAESSDGD